MEWPNNKKFAFTIIDDTDGGFIYNTKPIYDLLKDLNIKTTKTVWVYPPRDRFTGGYLLEPSYYEFIKELQENGFEIALHNVGSGDFSRAEIIEGIEIFKEKIGYYPKIQINHSMNSDNIYWGYKRFVFPIRTFYKLFIKKEYYGDEINHSQFWGDVNKDKIKYMRNHCFYGINTFKYNKYIPYKVKSKPFVNYFFSSSDGDTVEDFNNLIKKENIDKLESEGGLCIVYTHFSQDFVNNEGKLNEQFKKNLEYLSSKDGWFAPASDILDYLLINNKNNREITYFKRLKLDLKWLISRIKKKIKFKR